MSHKVTLVHPVKFIYLLIVPEGYADKEGEAPLGSCQELFLFSKEGKSMVTDDPKSIY